MMSQKLLCVVMGAFAFMFGGLAVHANTVFDTLPANDRANLAAPCGQTWKTGTLGAITKLDTIEIATRSSGASGGSVYLAVYKNNAYSGSASSWSIGDLVAVSKNSQNMSINGIVNTFIFNKEELSDNTRYLYVFVDVSLNPVSIGAGVRLNTGTGEQSAYSGNSEAFGGAHTIASRITLGSGMGGELVHSMKQGSVANFFMSSPARVEQYDLAKRQWLHPVLLSSSPGVPTAGWIDEDGIYAAYGTTVFRYDLDGRNEQHLLDASQTVSQIMSDGDILFLNRSSGNYARFTSIDKTDNTVTAQYDYYYNALHGASIAPSGNKLFGYNQSDITYLSYNDDGTFVGGGNSPYQGDYAPASKTWTFPGGVKVVDDSGTIYSTANLRYLNSFGAPITDITFYGDDIPIVLNEETLTAYTASVLPTGSATLDHSPDRIFVDGGDVVTCTISSASENGIVIQAIPLATLNPPTPGDPVDPRRLAYTPDSTFIGNDGDLYLFSKDNESIFRWDIRTQQYTNTLPLVGAPKFAAYSEDNNAIYTAYSSGLIRAISLADTNFAETAFAQLPESPRGLSVAGSYVFSVDHSGQWNSHYTFAADGSLADTVDWNYYSKDYVWSDANQKMYFFRDDSYPNDLLWEQINADGETYPNEPAGGIGIKKDSPLHSSSGFWHPIRVAPDGSIVVLGSGKIHDAETLARLSLALTNYVSDIAWIGDDIYTTRTIDEATEYQQWVYPTYEAGISSQNRGTANRLIALNDEKLVSISISEEGIPLFSVLDSELNPLPPIVGGLTITLPEQVVESDGVIGGVVTASKAPAFDLVVNLSFDDLSEISIPETTVVIPAGETQAAFEVVVLEDALLDGSQYVTIVAEPDHKTYSGIEYELIVQDNETATLTLSLPQTAYEGLGLLQGAVQVDSVPDSDIRVELRSSDTSEISSTTVIIPAGQTIVPVEIPVIDDEVVDGVQTVVIEASVGTWTGDSCPVFVLDNEQVEPPPPPSEEGEDDPETFKLTEVDQLTGMASMTKIEYCPERDLLFLMSGNDVRIMRGASGEVLGTRVATETFSDMDLTRDGRYLFVADYGGERTGYGTPINPHYVHRYDLDDNEWLAAKAPKIAWKIEAVSPDRVLLQEHDQHVDMTLNSFGETMVELSRIRADYYGDLEYDPVAKRAYHGCSGSSSREIHVRTVSGNTLVNSGDTGVYGTAQGGGGTSVLSTDGAYFFYGRLQVDAMNVRSNIRKLPEYIYAASSRIAFGKESYYAAHTGLELGDWGFTSGTLGVSEDGRHVWAYDTASSTLYHYIDAMVPHISVPVDALEGDGLLSMSGSVDVAEAPASDLVLNLSSSVPDEVEVPASVTVLAGETNAVFDIVVLDDGLIDGSQRVVISAEPEQQIYAGSAGVIVVHDNESASLSLTLPESTIEGSGGISGMVNVTPVPDRDVVVSLVSNNPNEISGGTVVIKAGEAAAAFTLSVQDDNLIEQVQTAIIEARVENWESAKASVFIADNDITDIRLALPAFTMEGDGLVTNAGEVILSGTMLSDVHIMLKSSDTSEVIVPFHVTIPAGQTNVFFDITAVDDDILDGKQYPVITASAPGFIPGSLSMGLSDNEFHHFTFIGLKGEDPGHVPAPCSVRAVNMDGEYVDTYSGPAWLSGFLGTDPVAVDPAEAIMLTNGLWQGDVTFHGMGDDALIVTDDGNGHTGTNAVTLAGLNIVKMATDWELPYIYMIHRYESSPNKSILIWYNTDSGSIEHAVSAGENATDLTVHYGDNRIYVSNAGRDSVRVIDRTMKTELPPLSIGSYARVNAGRPGLLFVENGRYLRAYNTTNGSQVAYTRLGYATGDGECTLDGTQYYHCDSGTSGSRLYRFDVSADTYATRTSIRTANYYGSDRVLVSMDGKRVYNCKHVYDADLNVLFNIGSEIYAASAYGELVVTSTKAYNGVSGEEIYSLPFTSSVMAFSGDQSSLLLFNAADGTITNLPTSDVMPLAEPAVVPEPASGDVVGANLPGLAWSGAPVAIAYDIYLGTDSNAVAAATTNDVQYLGRRTTTDIELGEDVLTGNQTYYWRVDVVSFGDTVVGGNVWNFHTASIELEPSGLYIAGMAADYTQMVSVVVNSGVGTTAAWTATCTNDWVQLGASGGTAPGTLDVGFDMSGLLAGTYTADIIFNDGSRDLVLPVTVEVEVMQIVKMATDWNLPYIYMIHTSSTTPNKSRLIWYNTATDSIEKVLEAGENATDLTVHYGDNRIYVSNAGHDSVRVFDRAAKTALPPLSIGSYARVNAGRAGLLFVENGSSLKAFDSSDGSQIASTGMGYSTGDGECTLDGTQYYHCDNGTSGSRLYRIDVSADTYVTRTSIRTANYYGSDRVLVSMDGKRVYNSKHIYDEDLNVLLNIGSEIYAASAYGDLVLTSTSAYNGESGDAIYTLPFSSSVMAFSGDQASLLLFDSGNGSLTSIDTADIMPLPSPGLSPGVEDGGTVAFSLPELSWAEELFAMGYDVYLGISSNAVASASTNSLEYLGRADDGALSLPDGTLAPDTTYYWRVDAIGSTGLLASNIWSFRTAGIGFHPSEINMALFNINGLTNITLAVDNNGESDAWTIVDSPAWLSAATTNGEGDSSILLSVDKPALAMGENKGVLTISSGGDSFGIPVMVLRLNEVVKCFEAAPDGKVYAASYESGHDQTYLLEINTEPFVAERVIELPENITDMDIDPSGTNLYTISYADGTISRLDIDSFSVIDSRVAPGTAKSSSSVHYHVEAGTNGVVYYVDAAWAPAVHVFDYTAGVDLSVYNNGGQGLGGIVYDDVRNKAYSWRQYGWSAGNMNSWVYAFDVVGNELVKTSTSSSQWRDPLASPLLLVDDGKSLINKKRRFNADDLTEVEATYAQDVYAATADGGLAIGSTKVYRGADGVELATLPVSSGLRTVLAGGESMVWYNTSSKTIELTRFVDLFDPLTQVTNRIPGNGETVMFSLNEFSWDIQDGARRFNVYLGTDSNLVAAATSDSPTFMGTTAEPFIGIPTNTLAKHETYFWRVDAVGYDGAVATGAVTDFKVSSLSVAPKRVDLQLLDTDYTASFALELDTYEGGAADWSITSSAGWLVPDSSIGTGPDSVTVTVDVSMLNEGVYAENLIFEDTDGYVFAVPVNLEVFPLNITKIEADNDKQRLYALNVAQAGAKPAHLVVVNTGMEQVEQVIPVVDNASDFAVHYGDDRIYVSAFGNAAVSVVDRTTSQRLDDLTLHTHVYRISAGIAGRLVTEDDGMGNGYYGRMHVWDSQTGAKKQVTSSYFTGRGTGESDAAGLLYYRGDSTRYPYAGYLRKYDFSGGMLEQVKAVSASKSARRELLVSADGTRVFWEGLAYDSELNTIANLGSAIYAVSHDGSMACMADQVLDVDSASSVATLPATISVAAFSSDGSKLALFEPVTKTIEWVALASGIPPESSPELAATVKYSAWISRYFAEDKPSAMVDSDGDGQCNLDEFVAGTDPTMPESRFVVYDVSALDDGSIVIRWDAVSNRVYNVDFAPSLTAPFLALETDIHYPQNSYTDRVQRVEGRGFYRIGVDMVEE